MVPCLLFQYKGVYRTVNPQNIDYSSILDDEDNLDASPSETVEIVLPRHQEGLYLQVLKRHL